MPAETPIACTLNAGVLDERLAEMHRLGARALVGLDVDEHRARLRFRGEGERVDALVAAESSCCAFLEFTTTRSGAETEVEIRSPDGGESVLWSFVAAIVAGWQGELV